MCSGVRPGSEQLLGRAPYSRRSCTHAWCAPSHAQCRAHSPPGAASGSAPRSSRWRRHASYPRLAVMQAGVVCTRCEGRGHKPGPGEKCEEEDKKNKIIAKIPQNCANCMRVNYNHQYVCVSFIVDKHVRVLPETLLSPCSWSAAQSMHALAMQGSVNMRLTRSRWPVNSALCTNGSRHKTATGDC